jgi:formylglycine-generating enzyme required for sulfatase activity
VSKSPAESAREVPAVDPDGVPPELEHFGNYHLLRVLGRGAQGVVYLAEDVQLGRKVALKMIEGLNNLSRQVRDRFQREAEITSKLQHPNICSIYGFGELRGTMYMAMQFVQGTTLADMVESARGGRTPRPNPTGTISATLSGDNSVQDVLLLVERTARALHVAHEVGLVHRDIKPGNIMVTTEGQPVLLDFGLAREVDTTGHTLTETGQVLGTPAYMAPEQLRAVRDQIDRKTDVYALGVTLFECLTLARPFHAETFEGLYNQILQGAPLDPRKLNARIPRDLATVIEVAIERDRARRYASALELAEELRRVRSFEPIHAQPAGPVLRLRKWARRRPAAAVAVAAGTLLLATLLGSWGWSEAAQRRTARERLARAEVLLVAGDLDGATAALAQARELRGDSVQALDLEARLVARRSAVALEARRAADLSGAEAARAESLELRERHAGLRAELAALAERIERESLQLNAGYARPEARAALARSEDDERRLRLQAEASVQLEREALERAARLEQAWGGSPRTEAAFAAFYVERWREARADGDAARAEVLRGQVERHDAEGAYAAELLGRGSLHIAVEPPHAELFLFRYESRERVRAEPVVPRLVPVPTRGIERAREGDWVEGFRPGDPCLAVVGVRAGSPAARAGLAAGDLVLTIAGEPVGEGAFVAGAPPLELEAAGVEPMARILALNGELVHGVLDWAMIPAPQDGGGDRIRFARVEGELEFPRAELRVASALEVLESGPQGVEFEVEVLHEGELARILVPHDAGSGLVVEPTAYPLIRSPDNRVEAGGELAVEPGSYLLLARAPDHDEQRFPIEVGRGQDVRVELALLEQDMTPPGFVYVPPGEFRAGGDPLAQESGPAERLELPGFFIARRELTNAEWAAFTGDAATRERMATSAEPVYRPRDPNGLIPAQRLGGPDTPVMGITWHDAHDFVAWRNRMAEERGEPWVFDLPSSEEWEKAARGVDGRAFPWGSRFDPSLTIGLHYARDQAYRAPGGMEACDESPYGVQDLGGLRTEWTRDLYVPEPDAPPLYRRRGGAWWHVREAYFRSASRLFALSSSTDSDSGMRLVARLRE